jgi:dihydroorotate dehydrogenase electron transfer subunit
LAAQGERAELIYGAKTAADLALLDDFQRLGLSVWPVTDDGSLGFHGNVADKLADLLGDRRPEELSAYACGPEPMLRAVCALVNAAGVPCQISVEARLACGFGVCLGCTIRTRSSQRLVCTDGPVFAASEFVWED